LRRLPVTAIAHRPAGVPAWPTDRVNSPLSVGEVGLNERVQKLSMSRTHKAHHDATPLAESRNNTLSSWRCFVARKRHLTESLHG
jgi:hypothetical protein